jgi:hypothetical protein
MAIPYGVSGFGVMSSVNGGTGLPYRDIDEQRTNR